MIVINGQSFAGRNITIANGRVIVDGKDQTPDAKEISIVVDGNLEELEVDFASSIEIRGSVGKARSGSGDINCGNITGGAQTGSGDIECESILGDVQTGSGDVSVMGNITGSVRTGSGDIKYRK
jgi:hypothetical protein